MILFTNKSSQWWLQSFIILIFNKEIEAASATLYEGSFNTSDNFVKNSKNSRRYVDNYRKLEIKYFITNYL